MNARDTPIVFSASVFRLIFCTCPRSFAFFFSLSFSFSFSFLSEFPPARIVSLSSRRASLVAQGVSATTAAACLASSNIITVLEMAPYKLHSADLQSAVYTINQQFNVQAKFFDKADPYATPTMSVAAGAPLRTGSAEVPLPANPLPLPAGWPAPPLAVGAYATTAFREYNKFTLNFPTPNTISGSTNWMEYQVTFNLPDDISTTCLAKFTSFHFLNDPSVASNGCVSGQTCYQGEWTAPSS